MRIWSTSTSRCFFFFSSRRRHTRCSRDWSSDVCSSDLVRGAEHVGWQGHWAVPESAPASRIPQVLAPPRPRVSRGLGIASGAGQLRHPQNSGSTEVAETPWALCTTLYSHQFQLAEFSRALVSRTDAKGGAAWGVFQRAGSDRGHRGVLGRVERESSSLCLDRQTGGDSEEDLACTRKVGIDSTGEHSTPA